MRKILKKAKELGIAFVALQGMAVAGALDSHYSASVPVPSTLTNILNNLIELLTNKSVVIPATVIAGAIGLYELMFSGTRGGEKLGKALIGGALVLAIASIVKSAFSG